MRVLFTILTFSMLFMACKQNAPVANLEQAAIKLGTTFEIAATKTVEEAVAILRDSNSVMQLIEIDGGNNIEGMPMQIKGKVAEVCQSAGCWLSFTTSDNKEFLVTIRNKAFKLPADLSNKEVIVKGGAYKVVTSVEELRHEARKNGMSQERILQIVEPIEDYYFSCEGIEILP